MKISEGELIEIEHRMRRIESYVVDGLSKRHGDHERRIEVCKTGEEWFADMMGDLRRLIDLARNGDLCAECGVRIEPYRAQEIPNPHRKQESQPRRKPRDTSKTS